MCMWKDKINFTIISLKKNNWEKECETVYINCFSDNYGCRYSILQINTFLGEKSLFFTGGFKLSEEW